MVNQDFQEATGRGYIGSQDIDIGFHLAEGSTREDLEKSEFSVGCARSVSAGSRTGCTGVSTLRITGSCLPIRRARAEGDVVRLVDDLPGRVGLEPGAPQVVMVEVLDGAAPVNHYWKLAIRS